MHMEFIKKEFINKFFYLFVNLIKFTVSLRIIYKNIK